AGLRRAAAARRRARARARVLDRPRRGARPVDDHRRVLPRAVRAAGAARRLRDRRDRDRDPAMIARWAIAAIAAGAAIVTVPRAARADPARFAVVVGSNQGERGELDLRYAERDAERFAAVLIELGGFPASNVAVVIGGDAEALRSAVIAVNDRIRSERAGDAMLVVYYSGHADAAALHLGRTALAIGQLEQLVRGSSASFRLLAVDACRSGVLTRVKGGRLAPPLPVVVGDAIAADG